MKKLTIGGLCILLGLAQAGAQPLIIDDVDMSRRMGAGLGALVEAEAATNGQQMLSLLNAAPAKTELELPCGLKPARSYEERVHSVFMVGSVYNCGKCSEWHPVGAATAWCLTPDGVMVTNHHVFEKAKGDSWGVFGMDGKAYRITEILAKDKDADVALFKVEAENLTPLALAEDAPVGTPVSIISHPDGRFFVNTSGEVSRYAKAQSRKRGNAYWMGVTAEYAHGSSGAPVMDSEGHVTGMVSNTQSIQYGPRAKDPLQVHGPHQMVIRNCVPAAAIRALIARPGELPVDQPQAQPEENQTLDSEQAEPQAGDTPETEKAAEQPEEPEAEKPENKPENKPEAAEPAAEQPGKTPPAEEPQDTPTEQPHQGMEAAMVSAAR